MDMQSLMSTLEDDNSLLILLNRMRTVDNFDDNSIQVLLRIHCIHSNNFVKYSATQVIIRCLTSGQLNLKDVFDCQHWHCFGQISLFLSRLLTKAPTDIYMSYQDISNEVSHRLSYMSRTAEELCEEHCLCCVCDTLVAIVTHSDDSILNQILIDLFKLFERLKKRCFIRKLINLLVFIAKQNDSNTLSMRTISELAFSQKSSLQRIDFSNGLHAFGGRYLSDKDTQMKSEYECDVVLLRQTTLLMLLCLAHIGGQQSCQRLDSVSRFVRNTSPMFDVNDWPIKLFIEEDEQLLCALQCLICLSDSKTSHFLMDAFVLSIGCDSGVLLDMLCSDEQTATVLLKLLIIYLKLDDLVTDVAANVRNVLLELREKMKRLTTKQLFPYNVKPLIRLLNKLD